MGQFAPDLILADFSLPSLDGYTGPDLAREECSDVPFIFVTGTLGEEVAIETLKKGATDYVLKHRLSRLVPPVQRALREAEGRGCADSPRNNCGNRTPNSTKVAARLFEAAEHFILEVKDNGRGISQSETLNTKSIGLIGMRERASLLGAKCAGAVMRARPPPSARSRGNFP